jgi:hypothetical protein
MRDFQFNITALAVSDSGLNSVSAFRGSLEKPKWLDEPFWFWQVNSPGGEP